MSEYLINSPHTIHLCGLIVAWGVATVSGLANTELWPAGSAPLRGN